MLVLYSPQLNEEDTLEYQFIGDKIIVTYNGQIDEFDFTDMPEGCRVNSYDRRNQTIISELSIEPIIEAERTNGVLKVTLRRFIGVDATEDELNPNWIEV